VIRDGSTLTFATIKYPRVVEEKETFWRKWEMSVVKFVVGRSRREREREVVTADDGLEGNKSFLDRSMSLEIPLTIATRQAEEEEANDSKELRCPSIDTLILKKGRTRFSSYVG
jgi:hypothetical protein